MSEPSKSVANADWIDATKGWIGKRISRKAIALAEDTSPNSGFHEVLIRPAKDSGDSVFIGGCKAFKKRCEMVMVSNNPGH